MVAPVIWPRGTPLPFRSLGFNPAPFSRGGLPSLGGISRKTRTDRGYWKASGEVMVNGMEARRTFNAIRVALAGAAGLVVVPRPACRIAPYPLIDGVRTSTQILVPFSDETTFDDGTEFSQQGGISVQMYADAPIGATSVLLQLFAGEANLVGVPFSYNHALYETGPYTALYPTAKIWAVPIFPAIRAPIPAGAALEFHQPDCLMHLATDEEMSDSDWSVSPVSFVSLNFIEATDYWNDLAVAA
jgi:hypothetical protein